MPKTQTLSEITAMDRRDRFTRYEIAVGEGRERIDTTYSPATLNEGLDDMGVRPSMMSELAGVRGSRNWLLIYMDGWTTHKVKTRQPKDTSCQLIRALVRSRIMLYATFMASRRHRRANAQIRR